MEMLCNYVFICMSVELFQGIQYYTLEVVSVGAPNKGTDNESANPVPGSLTRAVAP
jgi:hypothetical protein